MQAGGDGAAGTRLAEFLLASSWLLRRAELLRRSSRVLPGTPVWRWRRCEESAVPWAEVRGVSSKLRCAIAAPLEPGYYHPGEGSSATPSGS